MGGGTGYAKFIGPNHLASNYAEVQVTGALGWYGSSSNYYYLNSQIAPTDTTLAMNKTDLHVKCTSGDLYIYHAYSRVVFE